MSRITEEDLGVGLVAEFHAEADALEASSLEMRYVPTRQDVGSVIYNTPLPYGGDRSMAHLIRDKEKLIARVRRVRGQIDAIERALDQEAPCDATLQLIASSRGAMNGLMAEVLEGHIRYHVAGEMADPASEDARAIEQLIDIVRSYLK